MSSLTGLLAATGRSLTDQQIDQLERLVAELQRWNRRRNLTAITARDEIYEKHLLDSLTLVPHAEGARRLLDLGSGAGFPALPLKIACPGLEVVAVEAVAKKVVFQRHVVRTLGLTGYTAIHGRAETLADHALCRDGFDLVTARALGALPMLAALAKPLLAPGGRLIAMKSGEVDTELQEFGGPLRATGWQIEVQRLALPRSGAARCLVLMTRNSND